MDQTKLAAEKRTKFGSRECRKLRAGGLIPGNVYGHKEANVPIAVQEDALNPIVHAGHRVVDLDIGGDTFIAMFREVQWDTFGTMVQHVDLVRIDADERVEVEVPIELRGTAPGTMAGGVLDQHLRTVTVDCLAFQIPDSIKVRINMLEIGQGIHVKDLELPENMRILDAPEELVVQVIQPVEQAEPEEGAGGPAEPEVIGRKAEEPEEE
jgi:large subunit ribosomal protein L25